MSNVLRNSFFYITIFLFTSFLCVKYNIVDFDFFARLIQGWSVANNHSVMYQDVFSYTETHIWYDPEWLSSTLFYLIAHKYSFKGLMLIKIILTFFIPVMISFGIKTFSDKKKMSFNIIFFIFVLLALQSVSIISFLIRCQLFTYIIFALWLILLEKIRQGNDKLLYLLPFIMLFWLNCHGGCIAGVGTLVLYIIGEAINKKPIKKYFLPLFFVCLVFLINPWGVDFIKFMFESAYIDRSWIAEWQPGLSVSGIFYKIFLFVSLFSYIFSNIRKNNKIDYTKFIVIITLLYLSLSHLKHTGLYIIGASMFLYDDILYTFNYFLNKLIKYLKFDNTKMISLILNSIIYFVTVVYSSIMIVVYSANNNYIKNSLINFPVKAVDFLKNNNLKGNIFTPFYLGSYVAYKCYPNLKIYMDGRQEQVYYSDIFDKQMFFVYKQGKNFDNMFHDYKHDIFLFDKDTTVSNYLDKRNDFTKVYEDEQYVIYLKNTMVKFKYIISNKSNNELINEFFDSNFR